MTTYSSRFIQGPGDCQLLLHSQTNIPTLS